MTERIAALAALGLSVTVLLSAEDRMRAGLWEVITTVNGKPSGAKGGTCYTPAMVQLANSPAEKLKEASEKSYAARHCAIKDFKMEGNKIGSSLFHVGCRIGSLPAIK